MSITTTTGSYQIERYDVLHGIVKAVIIPLRGLIHEAAVAITNSSYLKKINNELKRKDN